MSWGKIQKGKYGRIQENITKFCLVIFFLIILKIDLNLVPINQELTSLMNRTTSEDNFLGPGKSVSSAGRVRRLPIQAGGSGFDRG